MSAIDRYQEILDATAGNRTGVYLSKEELQELLDYIRASEACGNCLKRGQIIDTAILATWEATRTKLGLV